MLGLSTPLLRFLLVAHQDGGCALLMEDDDQLAVAGRHIVFRQRVDELRHAAQARVDLVRAVRGRWRDRRRIYRSDWGPGIHARPAGPLPDAAPDGQVLRQRACGYPHQSSHQNGARQ